MHWWLLSLVLFHYGSLPVGLDPTVVVFYLSERLLFLPILDGLHSDDTSLSWSKLLAIRLQQCCYYYL